ncbi:MULTISPECIES: tripartite tricarboxylate transporter substrate binding protein [Ramlibacter]|uniref:Tripartite tricarboxylate transporter substrate binding protein n=1 Tax=Ramlibacter pinisoli TaxID=2682844 RepID=A0A6N8J2A2_9BURK|nr:MULTISPECIES: tripartite tricarboxylate transporter substrate binding protein [Ramlibacter]MBA2962384.1 tripartite tricarboxylate transporter substrate binding protein [Ramlibacter sp. CGMCC 1.13660]MVQ32326.1 tripartite tricarboxylate transporter substrate binding protein [Ramlibacter pinisoli]
MIPLSRILAALALSLAAAAAAAQAAFPSRAITMVVPYSAGGGVDTIARLIAPGLSERLGQAVVIDNRPGVSGVIGSQLVARAPADGYTLVAGNTTTHATNFFLLKNPGYATRDFVPVAGLDHGPTVLVVRADSRFQNVQDLIAAAKAAPDALTYGSSGNGSSHHLSAESFASATGARMRQIPYKGGPGVMNDLLGGQLDLAFEVIPVAVPLIKAGRLRALGVTSRAPMPALPGIKPIAELGVPNFELETWKGIFAPAGTPPAVVERLGRAVAEVVATPAVQQRMQELGLFPDTRYGAAFATFYQADVARWGRFIRDAGIQAD